MNVPLSALLVALVIVVAGGTAAVFMMNGDQQTTDETIVTDTDGQTQDDGTGGTEDNGKDPNDASDEGGPSDDNRSDDTGAAETATEYPFTVTCESGTADAFTVTLDPSTSEYTLTFTTIAEDTEYSVSGTLDGNVVIDVGDSYKFKLTLNGCTVTSSYNAPIVAVSADELTITAKKGTVNTVTDRRSEADENYGSAIYCTMDLDIQGKGALTVYSANNDGIHGKDDVTVKNLTLTVDSVDNALKGNDSVTMQSGTVTLISRQGDGIKTSNSEISSKGNQKGTVTLNTDEGPLTLNIYAACDGIDASYNVVISGDVVLNVYTDKYSSYSEDVIATSASSYYIRSTSNAYSYSIFYTDGDGNGVWKDSTYYTSTTGQGGMGRQATTYHYYKVDKVSTYPKMIVYVYSGSQAQGQDSDYTYVSSLTTVNDNYDTIAMNFSSSSPTMGWTNYTTQNGSGWGGMPQDGNSDKCEYSTKGIKADNSITISGGTVTIRSYDDAIHANSDVLLETNVYGSGDITITGGTLSLYSNDDGVHADGVLTISGGTVTVTNSYEGLEGTQVTISGGSVSVRSSDDGINATVTSGVGIRISGGYLYVHAGGDGLDSNSRTSKAGIYFEGGTVVVISTSGGNSCIDTEAGYTYSGGSVLAICPSGMTQEVQNYTISGSGKATVRSNMGSLSSGTTVTATAGSSVLAVRFPAGVSNAFAIYLGQSSATISSGSSSYSFDSNGVYSS